MDDKPKPSKKKKTSHGDIGSSSEVAASAATVAAAASAAGSSTSGIIASTATAQLREESAVAYYPTEDSLPHLCCSICLSFPENEVLQCLSGHILCRDCHGRVAMEDKPTCPTCRVALDPAKPIRNVLAEQTLALLPTACSNVGCTVKLTRGSIARHVASECPHRVVQCKYAPLGCKWEGIAQECSLHEDKCKKAELPGWKLLKRVSERQEAAEAEAAARAAPGKLALSLVDMLSSRCRNIEISHVTLHKCSAHEHVGGKPAHLGSAAFHALGFRWKLFTVEDSGAGSYSVSLQLRDSRMPLSVDFFIVRAPSTDARLKPAVSSHTFSPRAKSTDPLAICEGAAAAELAHADSMVLRVGLVDRRTGRLSRDFMGQQSGGGGSWGGADEDDGWDSDEASGSLVEDYGSYDGDGHSEDGGSMYGDEGAYDGPMGPMGAMGPIGGGRGRRGYF